MLSMAPITAFLSTTSARQAKAFYGSTLGLRLLGEDDFALVFAARGAPVRIQKVKAVTPQPFTALGWQVTSIRRSVRALAKRGVKFERYSFMEQDEDGIWLAPSGTRVAWLTNLEGCGLAVSPAGA